MPSKHNELVLFRANSLSRASTAKLCVGIVLGGRFSGEEHGTWLPISVTFGFIALAVLLYLWADRTLLDLREEPDAEERPTG